MSFFILKTEKFWRGLVMAGLLFLLVAIFSQTIEITTSDIGRHLENGYMISEHKEILFSNYYSYTEPNSPFINHHWLAGVVYYRLFSVGGFKALTVLNIILIMAAFLLAFRLARRYVGFYLTAFLSLPAILMLSERVEVRPEIFSYVFLFLLWSWLDSAKRKGKLLRPWLIPVLIILWVNTHIYFFLGLILIGIYALASFLESLLSQSGSVAARIRPALNISRPWWFTLGGAILASLVNPNTWRGLLYPFQIFRNYGYEIAENKTVFYLKNLSLDGNYKIFEFFLVLSVIFLILAVFKFRNRLAGLLAAIFFTALGCFAVRNISLFGLAALVTLSMNFTALIDYRFYDFFASRLRRVNIRPAYPAVFLLLLTGATIFYFFSVPYAQNRFLKSGHGWGVEANKLGSRDFFIQNNLSGPIFNNYDIGSALIFWLSGREKVFVDNRPEAYSVSFFNDIYKPMQLDPAVWESARKKYGFQAVYFAYTDSTPWAKQFLARILADKDWSLVYFDSYTVILVPADFALSHGLEKIDLWKFRAALREQITLVGLEGKFHLASLARLVGQADLSVEIYRDILSEYQDNTQALVGLSSYYAEVEDQDSLNTALYYLNRAYQSGYRLPEFYNQQAMIYWRLGQSAQAVANWQKALKINKKDIDALYYLNQVSELESSGQLSLPK